MLGNPYLLTNFVPPLVGTLAAQPHEP